MNFNSILDFFNDIIQSIKNFFFGKRNSIIKNPPQPGSEASTDANDNYTDDNLLGKFDYWLLPNLVRENYKEEAKIILKEFRSDYEELIESICSGKKTLILYAMEIEIIWDLDAKLIDCGFVIREFDEHGNLITLGSEITATTQKSSVTKN